MQHPQAPAKGKVDPALDLGELKRVGRRRLGQAERGGAGDQGAKDGVERVVALDASLAGVLFPDEPGRRVLERGKQVLAGGGAPASSSKRASSELPSEGSPTLAR